MSARLLRLVCLTILASFLHPFAFAQTASNLTPLPSAETNIPADRMNHYADLAVQLLREYLQVDTTNPPGNELRGAMFFKNILDREGIENQVFEYAPGRADLWARITANIASPKRPLILLNHMDVVTADASHWKVPPFSAQILDGAIYGRGAQDMKDEGIAHLMLLIMLRHEKVPLDRDIIFLAVADEEVNSTGTDWFIAHQRTLLGNAEFLINEGGENVLGDDGRPKFIGVDVGEKAPFWLHVVAHGRPGHGSRPNPDSAPDRLVRALNRIANYQTPFVVLPVAQEFATQRAALEPPERAAQFRDLKKSLANKSFQSEVEEDELLNAMLRNTIQVTMFGGSDQTNVIPPEAWANLDVRLLPGQDPATFLETLRHLVDDPNVTIEPQSPDFIKANYSPTDTSLFEAIRKISAAYFPGSPVAPLITTGYNETQRYRPLGIDSYGYNPYTATPEEDASEHGNDERIRIDEVRRGFRVLYDVVMTVSQRQP
jgi:acetylornithine deacetylase/succinyl-diaminopimelate desuccinylase-like protein